MYIVASTTALRSTAFEDLESLFSLRPVKLLDIPIDPRPETLVKQNSYLGKLV